MSPRFHAGSQRELLFAAGETYVSLASSYLTHSFLFGSGFGRRRGFDRNGRLRRQFGSGDRFVATGPIVVVAAFRQQNADIDPVDCGKIAADPDYIIKRRRKLHIGVLGISIVFRRIEVTEAEIANPALAGVIDCRPAPKGEPMKCQLVRAEHFVVLVDILDQNNRTAISLVQAYKRGQDPFVVAVKRELVRHLLLPFLNSQCFRIKPEGNRPVKVGLQAEVDNIGLGLNNVLILGELTLTLEHLIDTPSEVVAILGTPGTSPTAIETFNRAFLLVAKEREIVNLPGREIAGAAVKRRFSGLRRDHGFGGSRRLRRGSGRGRDDRLNRCRGLRRGRSAGVSESRRGGREGENENKQDRQQLFHGISSFIFRRFGGADVELAGVIPAGVV